MRNPWLILSIAAGLCVLSFLAWKFFAAPSYENYPPRSGPVVAFGDSLVRGIGAAEGKDFVSQVARSINEPVENFGVPGNTTREALARIDEPLSRHPRIVLILLGGNDYLQRIPQEETFDNLRAIIKRFQDDGALTVVLGVRGGLLGDHYSADYERLARETRSVYVSDVLKNLLGNKQYMSDRVHPNEEGYAVIAERVFNALRPVLR